MYYIRKKLVPFVTILALILAVTGCSKKESTVKYSTTDFAMGTTITELLYGTDEKTSEQASEEMVDILKKIEDEQISWRVKGSEVYKINHTDEEVTVDSEVADWLEQSRKIADDTDGALNPGVGTLAQLWDIGGDHPKVPKQSEIEDALKKIDFRSISQNGTKVTTDSKKVQVDLGAVGKGIGADKMMEYLKGKDSIKGAVISVGGSLCVYGQKDDGSNWNVGIQDPRGKTGEMLGSVSVNKNCFISTSGDYEKYIMKNGKRYHHILDSATGYPSESGLISVTILCDSGLVSDGLSTACFVLGMDKSKEILKKYHAEAIFVDEDKNVYTTDEIDFSLQADGYKLY